MISKEDLEILWHKDRIILSLELRLYLYWHERLQHPSHVTMHQLIQRGNLPPVLKQVKKAPHCAACLFVKAQRRAWRTKGTRRIMRKGTHKIPGKGTSANHMISYQPGLIPQVAGTLTHARYWGAVTMVDHAPNFSYSHLLKGDSNTETLSAKGAYERVMHSYGCKVKAYLGNNSRFDSQNFKDLCDKA
eukprot:7400850-Ditylum_brightwellii.AAC.1